MSDELRNLKLEEARLLEKEIELKEGLPHLYGFKFYKWQRKLIESKNRLTFLTASNQSGKSISLIIKAIKWATSPEIWKELWPQSPKPKVFFYLYPSYDVATREFRSKWEPYLLPRGKYKDHPVFGWTATFEKKDIKIVHFNSGVDIYFLAYAQSTTVMQATTAHAVFTDEELPEEHFAELKFRLLATNGYFTAAFTATLGQEFWRLIMEETGRQELFPAATKIRVTMFDCMYFEDGTPSHITEEVIKEAIASCPTDAEVQRRVYGRFVKPEGLRYPNFKRANHVKPPTGPPPIDWMIYCGVDLGSGVGFGTAARTRTGGHAAAITFVAVRPDFKLGRVFRHWNGKGHLTSAGDVFSQFLMMRADRRCAAQAYDYAAKDFGIISQRAGEGFMRANKDLTQGDNIINSLFRNNMMIIDDIEECVPLVHQLENLRMHESKTTTINDSADSFRYAVVLAPWDWEFLNPELTIIGENKEKTQSRLSERERLRLGVLHPGPEQELAPLPDEEMDYWQQFMDA